MHVLCSECTWEAFIRCVSHALTIQGKPELFVFWPKILIHCFLSCTVLLSPVQRHWLRYMDFEFTATKIILILKPTFRNMKHNQTTESACYFNNPVAHQKIKVGQNNHCFTCPFVGRVYFLLSRRVLYKRPLKRPLTKLKLSSKRQELQGRKLYCNAFKLSHQDTPMSGWFLCSVVGYTYWVGENLQFGKKLNAINSTVDIGGTSHYRKNFFAIHLSLLTCLWGIYIQLNSLILVSIYKI